MSTHLVKKLLPPIIPYIAVGIGLLVFNNVWPAILGYHAGMIAVILLSNTRLPLKQVFQSKKSWIPVITLLIGAGSGILLFILWPFLSVPDTIQSHLQSIGLNEHTWPGFIAYFVTVNPLLEEYYWRGYLASATWRITLNDVFFSGYHLIVLAENIAIVWLAAVFLGLIAGAWFWRQMNRYNEGLLASVVSHLAADITVILTIYYFSMH